MPHLAGVVDALLLNLIIFPASTNYQLWFEASAQPLRGAQLNSSKSRADWVGTGNVTLCWMRVAAAAAAAAVFYQGAAGQETLAMAPPPLNQPGHIWIKIDLLFTQFFEEKAQFFEEKHKIVKKKHKIEWEHRILWVWNGFAIFTPAPVPSELHATDSVSFLKSFSCIFRRWLQALGVFPIMQSVDEAYIVFLFFEDRLPVVIPFSLSVAVQWLFIQSVVVWIHTLCLLPFCLLPVAVHFLLSSWTLLFVFYLCKPFRSKCIKSLPSQFHQPTCCFQCEAEILSSHCPASSFVSFFSFAPR